MDQKSSEFDICQGVKQGGLLSADLYKLYVNDLLKMLKDSDLGIKIDSLTSNAVACAVVRAGPGNISDKTRSRQNSFPPIQRTNIHSEN